MKTGAIIQARTSSNRLPGKVLKRLPYGSGTTVIEQVVNRVKKATRLDTVVLATSAEESDKPLIKLAKSKNYNCFAGSLENVLQRYYDAAKEYDLDYIVRITGDCPCIDPELIDRIIDEHFEEKADFTNISLERTFPHGLDTAVFSMKLLKEANEKATQEYEKQHVTPYFFKTWPEKFKIHVVKAKKDQHRPDIRITLDTPEDYALQCLIYKELYNEKKMFRLIDIIRLFEKHPWLLFINAGVKQKKVHDNLAGEMTEALEYCKKQDLLRVKEILENYKP